MNIYKDIDITVYVRWEKILKKKKESPLLDGVRGSEGASETCSAAEMEASQHRPLEELMERIWRCCWMKDELGTQHLLRINKEF